MTKVHLYIIKIFSYIAFKQICFFSIVYIIANIIDYISINQSKELGIDTILYLSILKLPYLLSYTFSIISFCTTVQFVYFFSKTSQFIAIASFGISRKKICIYILFIVFIMNIFVITALQPLGCSAIRKENSNITLFLNNNKTLLQAKEIKGNEIYDITMVTMLKDNIYYSNYNSGTLSNGSFYAGNQNFKFNITPAIVKYSSIDADKIPFWVLIDFIKYKNNYVSLNKGEIEKIIAKLIIQPFISLVLCIIPFCFNIYNRATSIMISLCYTTTSFICLRVLSIVFSSIDANIYFNHCLPCIIFFIFWTYRLIRADK